MSGEWRVSPVMTFSAVAMRELNWLIWSSLQGNTRKNHVEQKQRHRHKIAGNWLF